MPFVGALHCHVDALHGTQELHIPTSLASIMVTCKSRPSLQTGPCSSADADLAPAFRAVSYAVAYNWTVLLLWCTPAAGKAGTSALYELLLHHPLIKQFRTWKEDCPPSGEQLVTHLYDHTSPGGGTCGRLRQLQWE
jgi:hypothetical protein